MPHALVVIPTYKERENIEAIIEAVVALPEAFDLLIVDDNSPDGTADLVRKMQRKHPGRIHLNERKGKLGLGTAYIHGFKWALKQDYQYIFEMDADFSHDPKDLPRLLEACEVYGADLAIGSRYSKGVNVVNWPMSRVLLSYFASKYVRLVTGMPIHDTTAGFKCYRRAVLEAIAVTSHPSRLTSAGTLSFVRSAIACAAAIFISSVMACARTSSAPRKSASKVARLSSE